MDSTCCRNGISSYRVLPVKFSDEFPSCHYMYYKQHQVRDSHEKKPTERTLIVLNVPPYCNKKCFVRLFSLCGEVQNVYFHDKPTSSLDEYVNSKYFKPRGPQGYKVAYVVFKSPKFLEKALKYEFSSPWMLSADDHTILTGVKKWRLQYESSILDIDDMNSEIENYMADYEHTVEEEKALEKKKAEEPDEEGWVTVTARGKKRGFTRTQTNIDKINKKERKKRAQRELLNFYTFQIRETKRDNINQLRKKFEDDKKKIALLRASRKFKPY